MSKDIIKLFQKFFLSLISIYAIATATFFLFELMPGDIYSVDNIKNPIAIQNIIEKYGLDQPVFQRYQKMLINLLRMDFGNSFINGQSVSDIIFEHFPLSLWTGCCALLISLVNGITIGSLIDHYKTRMPSKILQSILVLAYSFPTFEIAVLAQYIFCVKLKIFPVICADNINAMFLPIWLMSLTPTTFVARVVNANLHIQNEKDYVLAAKLRGVHKANIYFLYKLKNCMTSIITLTGTLFVNLIAGSFAIETIFTIPGLGRYFVTSITNRDYPLVMGLTLFYSILIITFNFAAEILITLNNWGKMRK